MIDNLIHMDAFDYGFTLITIVLGLALVAVLGGLARTIKSHNVIRMGLLTPLLGAFVISDIATMWHDAWEIRDLVPLNPWLGGGVLITSAYYIAASLVFPDRLEANPELDDYYRAHKRQVLGLIGACWIGIFSASLVLGRVWTPMDQVTIPIYLATLAIVWLLKGPKMNAVGLIVLLLVNASIFFGPF